MSFPPITVTLIRHVERGGTLHAPGERLTVPYREAAALIGTGFAVPQGQEFETDARPIRGSFAPVRLVTR